MKSYFIKTIKFLFRHLLYNPKKPKSSIINLLALLYLIILLFPYPFFQYKYTIDNFQIYSTSFIKNNELIKVIGTVDSLLSNSSIYDSDVNNKLFMCNNKFIYMFFTLWNFKWTFGVNHPFTNNSYLSQTNFSNDQVKNFISNSRSLSSVIAHEVMHAYLDKYMGNFKHRLFTKNWKKEGYCEYIATNSSFDIDTGFELIKTGKVDNSNTFKDFKYRLYVTYLLDIKGIKLETLIETEFDIDQLDNEIKTNINSLEEIFKIRMLTDGITIVE